MKIAKFAVLGLALFSFGLWNLGTTMVSTSQPSHPNIVFILTDDMDMSALAVMPKLKTLVTDQGTSFSNFFISFSLCCPSRTTILRSQYTHNTQIFGNTPNEHGGFQTFHALGEENSTIATWLQAAGYKTMLAGKYLNGYPATVATTYVPPGWSEWYSPEEGGGYAEYNYALNENGKIVRYGSNPDDYGTDVYAKKTIDFIQRTAKEGKPFFVYLSTFAPHSPSTPAPRHTNLFLDAKAPRTPNYNEADVSDKPSYIRNRQPLTPQEITRIDADTRLRLQSLQAVDEAIASIVDTLKSLGQLDNTYIFFSSDNGFHLGNHRQLEGKIAPYEEEIKVPLMVRGPGVPAGKTLSHLVGNVDFAPTWAEIASTKTPDFVDGRSLMPLLGSNPPAFETWRQSFIVENSDVDKRAEASSQDTTALLAPADPSQLEPADLDEIFAQPNQQGGQPAPGAQGIPPFRGLYTKDYTYIEYVTGEKELYDRNKDPYQLQNIVNTADPTLVKQLSERLAQMKRCAAATCRSIEATPLNVR
ncbi:sulfatase [Candidatus Acetothermia bacterium]|nr:sulfatase [Candidatus Acetothermia bacterium]